MTASVSASSPSGPHMWPDWRIMAGIDASTMTSEGTWRFVIPRSELTIARRGPSARPSSIAWRTPAAVDSSSSPSPDRIAARPFSGERPASSSWVP